MITMLEATGIGEKPLRFAVPLKVVTGLLPASCAVIVALTGAFTARAAWLFHAKWCSAPVVTLKALLVPVCPAPSLTVRITFESKVPTVTFPVHTPAVNAVVLVGVTVTAPPAPAPVSAGVPA